MATKESVFVCNGASNHTLEEREAHDFYATDPYAAEILLEQETFKRGIWEPACGQGHLSKVFQRHGYVVISTDLIDRGFGIGGIDFLSITKGKFDLSHTDIVTNPPYGLGKEFVQHALDLLPDGGKVAMFLKLTFMESKARKELFVTTPPIAYMCHALACNAQRTGTSQNAQRALILRLLTGGMYGRKDIRVTRQSNG
jgi:hypothetical protein